MEENTTAIGRFLRIATAAGIVPLTWSGHVPVHVAVAGNALAIAMVLVAATGWCPVGALLTRRGGTSAPANA
jgi:hypothetical protein